MGVLVARLNGNTNLEEYLIKNVFEPLHLASSTFMPAHHPSVLDRLVECVTRTSEGKLAPFTYGTIGRNPSVPQGSGGLHSTVPEYTAILADVVAEQPKLLRRETAELLFSPQLQEETPAMEGFKAAAPLFGSMLGSLIGGVKINHCLGGLLVEENSPRPGLTNGTATWAGGTGTFWLMNREQHLAAVYASQIFPVMDPKCLQLIDSFVRKVFQSS